MILKEKKNLFVFFFSSFTGIIFIAFLVRALAVIFSKGFVAHDDHFIPIETAYLWLSEQTDFFSNKRDAWRSPFYTLLHYYIFAGLQKFSITKPETQMLVIRALHGAYSLLTVIYGFAFAKKLAGEKTALLVGLLLAIFWVLPYVSVHSLVESACVPPIVIGFYYSLYASEERKKKFWIIAGFCFALAFTLRFQTFMLGMVIGIALIFQKRLIESFTLLLATLLMLLVIMGIPDYFAYGYPFASFIQYSLYNLNISAAVAHPWYFYISLLFIIFIFPSSLLFLLGLIHFPKKHSVYLISTLSFIVFHSFFSNKQERFMIPAVVLLLILGTIGWNYYCQKKTITSKKKKFYNALWVWFWFWNITLVLIFTPTSTKNPLLQTIKHLAQKNDLQSIFIQTPTERFYLPRFYLQNTTPVFIINSKTSQKKKEAILAQKKINYFIFLSKAPDWKTIQQIENLQRITLQKEKVFSYSKWQEFLWARSRGNSELKKILIYKGYPVENK